MQEGFPKPKMKHKSEYPLDDEDYGQYNDLISIAEEELEAETKRNQKLKAMKNYAEIDRPRLDNKRNKNYKAFKKHHSKQNSN